jgi:hypothetical protein
MLPAIREVAEGAMNGEGQLLRLPGPPLVMDEESLRLTEREPVLIWAGPCRYQPRSDTTDRTALAGDQPMTTTKNQLTLPWSSDEAHVDDIWLMTASNDPTLVGKQFRVTQVSFGEYQAERHLTVQDYETPRRV